MNTSDQTLPPSGPDFELIPDRLPFEIVPKRLDWTSVFYLCVAILAARATEGGPFDSHIGVDLKVVDGMPRLLLREVPAPQPGWHIEKVDDGLYMAFPES